MTHIYFLRHGEAEKKVDWKGEETARPLTIVGEQRMLLEAERMADLELGIQRIITSPLVCAIRTAEIVAERLGLHDQLVQDKRLSPRFGIDLLGPILADHPGATALLLVGHEPDLSKTIRDLIGGGNIVLETGGLACVELVGNQSLRGKLEWLASPGILVRKYGD
jgi:phosphohistidine phosphatase